jgi:type II secretory pathway pseudopilin PulG
MILISALLIITFLGSIIYIKSNQKKTQQRTAYQQQIQEVKNKKDSAESALIYHDETTARTEAEEARQLVAKLPCASKEEKITCTELNNQLETIFTKLRKITVVTPELLTTWESLQQNKTQPGSTKLNTQLIGFAENKNLLTTYNLTSNETGGLETTSTNIGFSSAAVPKENDYIVLVSNKNELTLFTQLDNTFKKIDVTYPAENSTISSIVVYNRRLYSLDTTNNQIYRHDTIKNGFGKGKEWVTGAGIDLKDGTSLTIDGDLWVLKNSGEIIKLTKGQQQQFALIGLDPTLKNGGKIWTYNELKYLYILDPIGKRLIIVTKDGVLQHQVVAKEFQNPTDMVVDEETKTAYIIDGSKLFKINLPI